MSSSLILKLWCIVLNVIIVDSKTVVMRRRFIVDQRTIMKRLKLYRSFSFFRIPEHITVDHRSINDYHCYNRSIGDFVLETR